MGRRSPAGYELDLFSQGHPVTAERPGLDWPEPARFPLNLDGRRVAEAVLNDLRRSERPLIVAGYASLDHLIDFVANLPDNAYTRVLFGQEPFASRRETFALRGHSFPDTIEQYWLNRGISLLLSAKILVFIQRLQGGRIAARYLTAGGERMHAKIYCGDEAVTLGSSNFTRPGLEAQLEANARFTRRQEPKRFDETCAIAENYWSLGADYNAQLIALLERLLALVPWQEALARACAELLEGEWASAYLKEAWLSDDVRLWPSQRQGIAQALYILARHDSVLVADATGSGKTRMGAHLIRAVLDQILRSGRLHRGKALMICPPAVKETWGWEALRAHVHLDAYSHGSLSHTRSIKHDISIEALRMAQVLCVDEGHNFINFSSNRTQRLLRNMADHMLLFTATPINRSVVDLLRIADLLGADNLEPSTLTAFRKMLGVRKLNRSLTPDEIEQLRKEIQRFTVRRTKAMLNHLIDREPEHYRDQTGRQCRYPDHLPRIYALNEPAQDRELAHEIRELAGRLYAVTHFERPIEMPEVLRAQGVTEESYLRGRLSSAVKIAGYIITASLRSSRAALAEHILGTQAAVRQFGLEGFTKHTDTGDVLGKLEKISGQVPKNRLSIPLPEWLTDPDAHREACAHDQSIYRKIVDLLMQMSNQREQAKVRLLADLTAKNDLLLAFDTRPITLELIRRMLEVATTDITVLVATGDKGSERGEALETFLPGSGRKGVVGLCSDSLSEGVNLQQASALVHLDMPSVVRIAEQRVGRVDRMDSPHKSIEAWWPDDAPEFALTSDERFIERYETVESLLGSNLPLPKDMLQTRKADPVKASELIEQYRRESEREPWDGIRDAFEPVRSLVAGDRHIINEDVYLNYCNKKVRVLSRVSLVAASSPWAFFCVAAGTLGAPRWVMLPGFNTAPVTELESVCDALRQRLGDGITDLPMNDQADRLLNIFLDRLSSAERSLLSQKKQRALDEMETVIGKYLKSAGKETDQARVDHFHAILEMLRRPPVASQPDWDEVAIRWLDVIRPVWYERLKDRKRKRPLLLKDIRNDLIKNERQVGDRIIREFHSFPVLPPPDERIMACIIGVA